MSNAPYYVYGMRNGTKLDLDITPKPSFVGLPYNPEQGAAYDLAARGVRTRLRAEAQARAPVWSGSKGTLAWPPAVREQVTGDPLTGDPD